MLPSGGMSQLSASIQSTASNPSTALVPTTPHMMIPYPTPMQTPLPKSQEESMTTSHSSSYSSSSFSSSYASSYQHQSSACTSPEPDCTVSASPKCPDLSTYTRVPDLFFPDGNLVLKVGHTIFKIYRQFLCARSTVFRDMFEFPPPMEGNLMWDGCSVVELWDEENDAEVFLRALLDSSFFEPPPSKTTISTLRGILRLSTKYDVPYLRQRAILHLETTFPTSLASWKNREVTRTLNPIDNTPFAALKLAREMSVDWVIPSIVYCVCSHPLEKVLDGTTFEDEVIELEWDQKRKCIKGRQELINLQVRSAIAFLKSEPAGCVFRVGEGETMPGGTGRVDRCRETRLIQADQVSSWDMAGLLDYVRENRGSWGPGMCEACRKEFEDMCARAEEDMWNELPGMFGLEDWGVLEGRRVGAFSD